MNSNVCVWVCDSVHEAQSERREGMKAGGNGERACSINSGILLEHGLRNGTGRPWRGESDKRDGIKKMRGRRHPTDPLPGLGLILGFLILLSLPLPSNTTTTPPSFPYPPHTFITHS